MTLIFRHSEFAQRIEIEPPALTRFRRYRQLRPCSREAGGQLFGSVDAEVVRILVANGPRRTDERSRTSFRSDPVAAQSEIDQYVARGLVYLGEWHTHPEPQPTVSRDDIDAFSRLLRRSRLRISVLFLLIHGTDDGGDAIAGAAATSNVGMPNERPRDLGSLVRNQRGKMPEKSARKLRISANLLQLFVNPRPQWSSPLNPRTQSPT
ncbi:Mov34/MPN/PAD-1 family protein [Ralstonia pseudosolanacearum]